MSKIKKIEREYQLGDSSVNVYGFRMLTNGYQKHEYERNPIGYKMHNRDNGVVLRWEGIRIDGDRILAKPVINLSHPHGEQIAEEVENGFLNAASFGKIVALEWSDDASLKLEGQTGPTITKWYNKECSLVDIPGNENSLAGLELFDMNGDAINLADFKIAKLPTNTMKQVILSAAALSQLNLKDDSDVTLVENTVKALVEKAKLVDSLTTERDTLTTEVATLKKAAQDKEINDLVDGAINDKKILPGQKDQYKKLALADLASVKAILEATPASTSIQAQIDKSPVDATELADLMAKSADELFKSDKLQRLKDLSMPHYKIKYKELTGKEHQD